MKLGDVIETEGESFRVIEFLEEPNTGLANVECIRDGEVFQVRTVPVALLEAAMGLSPPPTDADAERGRILDVIRLHLSALPQGDPGRAALADLATDLVLPKEASDG